MGVARTTWRVQVDGGDQQDDHARAVGDLEEEDPSAPTAAFRIRNVSTTAGPSQSRRADQQLMSADQQSARATLHVREQGEARPLQPQSPLQGPARFKVRLHRAGIQLQPQQPQPLPLLDQQWEGTDPQWAQGGQG